MEKLNINWMTSGLIDFEYKKYVLLGYLQQVSKNFSSKKLYPFLSDLIYHYQTLVEFKEKKTLSSNNFTHNLRKIDLEKFKLKYENAIDEHEFMEEIEAILQFAIPKIRVFMKDGKEIYDLIEENLKIEPIGVIPLSTDFGYMMLKNGNKIELKVYKYEITLFEKSSEKYRAIKTNYITSFDKNLNHTYEALKLTLIKLDKSIPNPATYLVCSEFKLPLQETLLPIAKRELVRFISRGELA